MAVTLRRWHVWSTVLILGLSIVLCLWGLLRPGYYNDPAGLVRTYRMQDLTILVVGVPVLALGLRSAAGGAVRGHLVWLGGLAFMAYIWASIALQVAFNQFFLAYVALFGLSLYTLVGGVLDTDPLAVAMALEGRVSTSLYGGLVLVIATGLAGLWLADVVPPLLAGTVPLIVQESGPQATVSHVIDLAVVVPALVVAGVWLLQGRLWGYVIAGVMLVFGATLSVTVSAMTVVFIATGAVTVPPVAAVLSFLPVLLAALLAVTYVAAADGRGGSTPSVERHRVA